MQRILVVDDDRLVADTLTWVFQKNGYDARPAYTAEDALQHAREFQPNLMLCDITLPGRDGLTLVRDITREFPACRIIVLTGFHSNLNPVREQAAKLSHPLGVLTKPCQPVELLRQANAMLASA